jgi:hypothetical protein
MLHTIYEFKRVFMHIHNVHHFLLFDVSKIYAHKAVSGSKSVHNNNAIGSRGK